MLVKSLVSSLSFVLPCVLIGFGNVQEVASTTNVWAASNYEVKTRSNADLISATTGSFNSVKGIHNSRIGVDKIAQATSSKTYYVSGTGNDSNDGLTTTTAFLTLQQAANNVSAPGDTVYVMNGTYTGTDPTKEVLVIWEKVGSATAPITFKAYPGHKPIIKSQNPYAINVVGSSYLVIEGLQLVGNNDNVTYDYAVAQKNNLNNPLTSGIGIGLNPSYSASGGVEAYPHHIVIRNNKISKFGDAAIGAYESDYITIENNVVFENCLYSPLGPNTITMLHDWNYDNNTTDYKMIIQGNISHDNQSIIPNYYAGRITEGNGIMIDDNKNTQTNSTHVPYSGKTLIANNIVYNNGAAGINVFSSANVDVVNNTSYQNQQNPSTPLGEIATVQADQVNVFNNILYPSTNGVVNNTYESDATVLYGYNLVYNSYQYTSLGLGNILGKDPQFVAPTKGDFSLKYGSPAIDTGISTFNGAEVPTIDQRGSNGIAIIDIGAL